MIKGAVCMILGDSDDLWAEMEYDVLYICVIT